MLEVIVIGAGRMGREHAHAISAAGDEVIAFLDPDLTRAESAAAEIGGEALAAEADLTGKPVNRDTWVALANELEGLAMAQRTREILLYTKSCRIAGKAVVESDGRALL